MRALCVNEVIGSLDIFKGIDLSDSFVLSWSLDDKFSIEIEASVWPESEHYLKPLDNEYTCYRNAVLTFSNFSECVGVVEQNSRTPTRDLDGTLDYGNIDSFTQHDSGYEILGDFGSVVVGGGKLSIRFYT